MIPYSDYLFTPHVHLSRHTIHRSLNILSEPKCRKLVVLAFSLLCNLWCSYHYDATVREAWLGMMIKRIVSLSKPTTSILTVTYVVIFSTVKFPRLWDDVLGQLQPFPYWYPCLFMYKQTNKTCSHMYWLPSTLRKNILQISIYQFYLQLGQRKIPSNHICADSWWVVEHREFWIWVALL